MDVVEWVSCIFSQLFRCSFNRLHFFYKSNRLGFVTHSVKCTKLCRSLRIKLKLRLSVRLK
jgi:hypothetical protein